MAYTTHSGPLRVGTVKEGSGRNTGNVVLSQSANVSYAVMLQSPAAQLLFTLPAGSKILCFRVEKTTTIAGGSVSAVGATFGTAGSANAYMTTATIGLTTAMTATATLDAALVSSACNNIGTADVPVYGTFTATTGDPTSGAAVVTVMYTQRATDGAQYPSAV